MSRTRDVAKAIDEINKNQPFTEKQIEEVKAAMLCHMALSLAVIADKLTEKEEMTK